MDNLLPEPHQADEGAQSAGNHKTALETVCKQVVSARGRSQIIQEVQDAAGGLAVTGQVLLKVVVTPLVWSKPAGQHDSGAAAAAPNND